MLPWGHGSADYKVKKLFSSLTFQTMKGKFQFIKGSGLGLKNNGDMPAPPSLPKWATRARINKCCCCS